jgi:hypothetical protein
VHAVIGHWRPEQLQRVWPGLDVNDASQWPSHLPHHVLAYVDNDDRFPYLIEYRSSAQMGLATSAAGRLPAHRPLASFEFFDVHFATAVPARLFRFSPGEINWHDITNRVIQELRPPAPAEAESTARRQATWR